MTRSQFVSRDGKDSCPCPHIQNGFSPPKIFLKRKEAPFRCAVSTGAECSLDIEKNPFSVFMGIRNGLSFSGDQDCFADDSRFPEPETALLPLVLDERLDTFMGKFNRRHKKRTISRMIQEDGGCWFPFFLFPREPVREGTCSCSFATNHKHWENILSISSWKILPGERGQMGRGGVTGPTAEAIAAKGGS